MKEIMDAANAFAREHLPEAAAELVEWSATSILRDGRVRELSRMLARVDESHSLTLAENLIVRAALERVAKESK
jgi:hypothetical protein